MNLFVERVLQAVVDTDLLRTVPKARAAAEPRERCTLTCEWGLLSLWLPRRGGTLVPSRYVASQSKYMRLLKSMLVAGEVSAAEASAFAHQLCDAPLARHQARRIAAQINWEIAGAIRRQTLRDYPCLAALERARIHALCEEED